MAFDVRKLLTTFLCVSVLVAGTFAAASLPQNNADVNISLFDSKQNARVFFASLPQEITRKIHKDQLWLDVYKNYEGGIEYHINISNLPYDTVSGLCAAVINEAFKCALSSSEKLFPGPAKTVPSSAPSDLPLMLQPLGLRPQAYSKTKVETFDLEFSNNKSYEFTPETFRQNVKSYGDNFSLKENGADTLETIAAKAAYETARQNFLNALTQAGTSINNGQGNAAASEEILTLGQKAYEAAGSAYLSGFLEKEFGKREVLSSDTGSGKTFVHHVRKNLSQSATDTIKSIIANTISGTGDTGTATDTLMLSGVRSIIDAGLATARRSALYALRNLELEYSLNNLDDSYLSALITQPLYQSMGLRHNIFFQASGIINEQSVDTNDDVSRHTLNIGAAYRYLTVDEKHLLGANVFFDHQWPYNHARLGLGVDAKSKNLSFAANYYHPLTGFQDSRTDAQGNEYQERALKGFDIEFGYTPPLFQE